MVLTCPHCRGALTVSPAPAPYAVACPHCRNPLTVPAVAPQPPDPEPADEAPDGPPFETAPRKRSKYQPARSGGAGKWIALAVAGVVLVAVVGVALFGIGSDQSKLDRLNLDWFEQLRTSHGKPVTKEHRQRIYERLLKKDEILKRHPDWSELGPNPSQEVRDALSRLEKETGRSYQKLYDPKEERMTPEYYRRNYMVDD